MKKIILPLLIVITIVYSCGNKDKKTSSTEKPGVKIDSTLITDSTWGSITRSTDFADLQSIFGTANVKDETICAPECADSIDVTKVYADKPNEIIVYWKDGSYHKEIASLENYMENGPYHTSAGLKIGSTLEDMLKVNDKKQILFNGFDWDYGGYVKSFAGGPLENSPVTYRLTYTESNGEISGDEEFDTNMPEVQKALKKITISSLSLLLNNQ